MLETHHIPNFKTRSGYHCHLSVSYQLFGEPLGSAPVVLVNHALTGNSQVTGEYGWWSQLIGTNKSIDTTSFTILAIDIPGNGYDGIDQNLIHNYKAFHLIDIAQVQLQIIDALGIDSLYAVIGGSLGGQLAWQLAVLIPERIENLIPIATDWKATDWVIAQTHIQDQILNNSLKPIVDARMHAMTFYRTAQSFKQKFHRQKQHNELYAIQSWLNHHGQKLKNRYALSTYKLMNHLLGTADIAFEKHTLVEVFKPLKAKVHLIAIDSDGLFLADEIYETYQLLKELEISCSYYEIQSIHGHDAFLIEFDQLNAIISPLFERKLCHK